MKSRIFPLNTVTVRRRLPNGQVAKKTIPSRKIKPQEITTFHYEGKQ